MARNPNTLPGFTEIEKKLRHVLTIIETVLVNYYGRGLAAYVAFLKK